MVSDHNASSKDELIQKGSLMDHLDIKGAARDRPVGSTKLHTPHDRPGLDNESRPSDVAGHRTGGLEVFWPELLRHPVAKLLARLAVHHRSPVPGSLRIIKVRMEHLRGKSKTELHMPL